MGSQLSLEPSMSALAIVFARSSASPARGGIIRVHATTGEQTKVSSGKRFGGHRKLAVVPAGG